MSKWILDVTGVKSAFKYSDVANFKSRLWIHIRSILKEKVIMAPSYRGARIALHSSIQMKIHSFNDMKLSRTLVLIMGVLKKNQNNLITIRNFASL